jgi:hypothetical protein
LCASWPALCDVLCVAGELRRAMCCGCGRHVYGAVCCLQMALGTVRDCAGRQMHAAPWPGVACVTSKQCVSSRRSS